MDLRTVVPSICQTGNLLSDVVMRLSSSLSQTLHYTSYFKEFFQFYCTAGAFIKDKLYYHDGFEEQF